jgi:hypothetical protein
MLKKKLSWIQRFIWKRIEDLVDLHTTNRLIIFHDALVKRKQIQPLYPIRSVHENEVSSYDYK